MSIRSILKSAALAAVALAAPVVASAATMTISQTNPSLVFNAFGFKGVKVFDADLLPAAGQNVLAGAFDLKASPAQTFTDASGRFTAFCLDIVGSLHLPSLYTETLTPFTGSPLTALQRSNVGALFETAFSTLNLFDANQSAGFQLALWEVVNESGAVLNVSSGNFYASGAGAAGAIAAANVFLAGIGGPITKGYDVHYLEAIRGEGQDLVTVSAVPVPAAGWMLIAGLGALVASRRRKA